MSDKNINPNSESVNNTTMKKNTKKISRKSKRRIISVVSICLVIAAAVLINIISGILTDKFTVLTADITSNGSFNISEASQKIAQSLKKKVTITFLTDRASYEAYDTYCKQATTLVDQMKKLSNGLLTVEYTDLLKNPNIENEYQNEDLAVTDVIVKCGDKYNLIKVEDMFNFDLYGDYQYIASSKAEAALDSAIVKVTSDTETKVAILTDKSEDSYSTLETVLASNNYILTPISIESDNIPDDISTVIAWAPTEDYSTKAINKIKKYLKNDGKYDKNFIFVAYRYEIECPKITALLKEYGMTLQDGLAFESDTSRMMTQNDAYRNIAATFDSEQYISNYTENDLPVLVSMSRTVSISGDNTESLVQYSSQSGICPYSADENWNWQDYVVGNVPVVAQGVKGNDNTVSRLIFVGSTMMLNDQLTESKFTNRKYLFNILNEINHREDDTIYLDDKVITEYDLSTVSAQATTITGVIIYAVIPLLILGAGLCVFVVRRRK